MTWNLINQSINHIYQQLKLLILQGLLFNLLTRNIRKESHTHTHTHVYIYIYIYREIYKERERDYHLYIFLSTSL